MKLATREQIYKIDQATLLKLKLSSSELIEQAAKALADRIEKLPSWPHPGATEAHIGVWCGPGHNGDDGRVVARLLKERNYNTVVVEGTGWDVAAFDWIVDAYFGVGLNRGVSVEVAQQIKKIRRRNARVVSLDIPTGIDANRGVTLGESVRANYTLTILPAKPGLFVNDGPTRAGKIIVVDIGLPIEILNECANTVSLVGSTTARKILRPRSSRSNKTSFGHLLIIAGSDGMEGAALLSAEAAARMGCGYVTLCSPSKNLLRRARPDFLSLSIQDYFQSDLQKYSAVLIGPGLGVNEQSARMLEHLQQNHGKVVADADALTLLSKRQKIALPMNWLLTPHAGELARLLGARSTELEADRLGSVQRAARELNAHILFKGFRTVLGNKEKTWIIGSGNVALAKAGSGDVLAGFIGSLMAQGHSTKQAGILGAYLHGHIADEWLRLGHSTRTLMASDLADRIDASLWSLKKART